MVQAQVMGHDDRHPNPYQSHDDKELVLDMERDREQALGRVRELVLEQVLVPELGMGLRNHDRDHQNHDLQLSPCTSYSNNYPFVRSLMEQLAF